MKHFVMTKAADYRKENFLLLTMDGDEFEPFQITMKNLVRQGFANNTIEQYAGHIARFIDYIYEAAEQTQTITSELILEIVYGYKSYLLFGLNSSDPDVKKIAKELRPERTTSPKSLLSIGAAIKYFLTLSDVNALTKKQNTIFDHISLSEKRELSEKEKIQLKQNSMLAGVIKGGPEFTKRNDSLFGKISCGNSPRMAMPFDKIGELIEKANSYRDKTFYSLLAASGCRQHEALQVRFRDISFEDRRVLLIDPFSRKNNDITESEYKQLSWKKRATPNTFLIEPFKTLFFENLEHYIRHERIAHGENDFVFQKNNGRPFFTAKRQSRIEIFNKIKTKMCLENGTNITAHSIRHMYGFYALNYLPLQNGFGLPMPIVKLLMGHSSIKSTEIYAKQDEEKAKIQIEYANQLMTGLGEENSLEQIRLQYHQYEIDRILALKRDIRQ